MKKKMGQPIGDLKLGTDIKYTFKVYKVLRNMKELYDKQKKVDDDIISKHLKDNDIKAESAEGLYYNITSKTDLPKVKAGDTVSVHYRLKRMGPDGKILDQTIDSSYDRNEPFPLVVGAGMVIQGWDLALQKLNIGEKATLYIPSWLGYGPTPKGELIPANSILVFDVHIIDKNAPAAENIPPSAPEPEIEEVEPEPVSGPDEEEVK